MEGDCPSLQPGNPPTKGRPGSSANGIAPVNIPLRGLHLSGERYRVHERNEDLAKLALATFTESARAITGPGTQPADHGQQQDSPRRASYKLALSTFTERARAVREEKRMNEVEEQQHSPMRASTRLAVARLPKFAAHERVRVIEKDRTGDLPWTQQAPTSIGKVSAFGVGAPAISGVPCGKSDGATATLGYCIERPETHSPGQQSMVTMSTPESLSEAHSTASTEERSLALASGTPRPVDTYKPLTTWTFPTPWTASARCAQSHTERRNENDFASLEKKLRSPQLDDSPSGLSEENDTAAKRAVPPTQKTLEEHLRSHAFPSGLSASTVTMANTEQSNDHVQGKPPSPNARLGALALSSMHRDDRAFLEPVEANVKGQGQGQRPYPELPVAQEVMVSEEGVVVQDTVDADVAAGNQNQRNVQEIARAVTLVYTMIRRTYSNHLNNDGSDINAELTQGSVDRIIRQLQNANILTPSSIFMDGGCSFNVAAAHLAQVVGCRVWGCEYVMARIYMGSSNMMDALESDALINPKIAYAPISLLHLRSLGDTTVAYYFDEAFDTPLVRHNAKACRDTPSVQFICSFKASKTRSVHSIFAEYGFELRNDLTCIVYKHGSGAGNTIYVYERFCPPPAKDVHRTDYDRLVKPYVDQMWSDVAAERLQCYALLHARAHAARSISSKCRKDRKVRDVTVTFQVAADEVPRRSVPCECLHCYESTQNRILLLGVVYGQTSATTEQHLIAMVKKKRATPAEARDTARCLLIEKAASRDGGTRPCVFTVSALHSRGRTLPSHPERHIWSTFGHRDFVKLVQAKVIGGLDQICLDYVWMPKTYFYDRLGPFFVRRLQELMRALLKPLGVVFLPFHRDMLEMLATEDGEMLLTSYPASFVATKEGMLEHKLWSATEATANDPAFGKNLHEAANMTCRIVASEVRDLPSSTVKTALQTAISDAVCLKDIRFIRLQAVQPTG